MPRDTAGNYTLPAGNPVASGEIISASWANSTMNDLGQSLSASLDRYGRGGMLAPFQFTDGTESAPGATWSNEPTTGLYRAAYGDLRFTLTGTDVQRWTSANAYLWRNSQWEEILTQTGGGGDTTINNLVVTGSFTSPGIDDNATSTAITIDANENVGIVTTQPGLYNADANDLVVGRGSGAEGNRGLTVASGSTSFGTIAFANGSTGNDLARQFIRADHNDGAMLFATGAGEKMRITSAGNVGIGTPAPQYRCQVKGSPNTAVFAVNDGSYAETGRNLIFSSSNNGQIWDMDSQGSDGFGQLAFSTNSTERLRIDAAGTTTVTGFFSAAQPGAGTDAFAAGTNAGASGQGSYTVAVGRLAAQTSQGGNAVAIGNTAGRTSQGGNAVAVGVEAGNTSQGTEAVAIGWSAGEANQGAGSVAIGLNAGAGVANDPTKGQGTSSVAVGRDAGNIKQGTGSIAVGPYSAFTTQGISSLAVGYAAGNVTQGDYSVAVGREAGKTDQGNNAVAIGYDAGKTDQGTSSVAVGLQAGNSDQGATAVSLGYASGMIGQGDNSIAIGNRAGQTSQAANGIIINSSGAAQNATSPNHIFLASGTGKYLYYNGSSRWEFEGGDVAVPNDNLLVGSTTLLSSEQLSVQAASGTTAAFKVHQPASTSVHTIFYNSTGVAAKIDRAGLYTQVSDRSLKHDIKDSTLGLAEVLNIPVRSFKWNGSDDYVAAGFIAQELEQALPSAVSTDDESGLKGRSDANLTPVLVKAMQEQQAMIETLKAEVAALKGA